MNIETLKQLIELSKLLDNTETTLSAKKENEFEWKYVLVRWYDAWVWAWKLIDWTHWNIILEDARMLWRWRTKSWIWLSSMAVNWLDENRNEIRILETQKKILINDLRVSTFFICTPEVEKQLREYKVAVQN